MVVSVALKRCSKCKTEKAVCDFSKSKATKDGLNFHCRACMHAAYLKRRENPEFVQKCREQSRSYDQRFPEKASAARKAWYKANKESSQAVKKAWREANSEKLAGYFKAYRERHPERVAATQARYYRENREKILAADKARRDSNLEVFRERERQSHARNKEARAAKDKSYRTRNPFWVTQAAAKRRAALLCRTPKWLTSEDLFRISTMYQMSFALTKETGIEHHVDHIIPLRGRYVSGLHVPDNLQVIPGIENLRKNNSWVPQ